MEDSIKKIGLISALVLVFGGWGALGTLWSSIWQVLVAFFPFFADVAKQQLEDYLTSPYFITGLIMAIASCFGIWFGSKGGKVLYAVVSIITLVISLVSIGANIF